MSLNTVINVGKRTISESIQLWLSGDAHSLSDAEEGAGTLLNPTYEPIKEAVNQLKVLYPNLAGGINVGDYSGSQGTPNNDDGVAHTNQITPAVFSEWNWEDIMLISGNHDKVGNFNLSLSGANFFNGGSQIVVPNGDFSNNSPFTLMGEIFMELYSDTQRFIARSNGNSRRYLFSTNSSSKLLISIEDLAGNKIQKSSVDTLVKDKKYHIAVTFDGISEAKLFIDGIEVLLTDENSGTYSDMASSGTTKFGEWDVTGGDFRGVLRNWVITKQELSPSQILEAAELNDIAEHSEFNNFDAAYSFSNNSNDITGNSNNGIDTNINYFRNLYSTYIDPLGEYPSTSNRNKSNRNVSADFYDGYNLQRYKFGNIDFLGLNDINDTNPPIGADDVEEGGFPATTSMIDSFAKAIYLTLSNPNINIVWGFHENPRNTTTNTWDYCEGGLEHNIQEKGNPCGRGRWHYMTDDKFNIYEAQKIYDRWFGNTPDNFILMVAGHTHRKIASMFEVDSSRGEEQRIENTIGNTKFLNIANLSQFHGAQTHFGDAKSWIWEVNGKSSNIKLFTHRNNSVGNPAGEEYQPLRQSLNLKNAYSSTFIRTDPNKPTNQPTGLILTPSDRSINLSFTKATEGHGHIVVRSESAITWIPTDNTEYYPNQEVDTGVFVVYIGTEINIDDEYLIDSTSYNYAIYSYAGGNDKMLWNTSTPLTGNVSTTTANLINLTTIENPEIAIDYLDLSQYSYVDATSDRISQINNKGSWGFNFQPKTSFGQEVYRRSPTFTKEGIRSNGNSGLIFQGSNSIDAISNFDIMIVKKESKSPQFADSYSLDFKGAIKLKKVTNKLAVEINDSTDGTVQVNGNGSEIEPALANGYIIEHIRLIGTTLEVYHNNILVGSSTISTTPSLSEVGGDFSLLIDRTDTYTNSFAGYIKGVFCWFGSNISDRTAVYNHINSVYGVN